MTPDGHFYEHHVKPGRTSANEVIVVFELRNVEFVPASLSGSDFEKKVRQGLEAKLAE